MNRRFQHKIEKLKKLGRQRGASVFSIPVHEEQIVNNFSAGDDNTNHAEVFSVGHSIVVKQAE